MTGDFTHLLYRTGMKGLTQVHISRPHIEVDAIKNEENAPNPHI